MRSNRGNGFTRREALKVGMLATGSLLVPWSLGAENTQRKFTINLMPGMIGVGANQLEAIELASKHGFESVEAMSGYLAGLGDSEARELQARMKEKKVVFGAAGLPVDFRNEEEKFTEGMRSFEKQAKGLQRAGVTRMGTYIMPGHNKLTHLQNLKLHARRLREIAKVLDASGLKLGLEYVGTKTLRDRYKFEFVHTMPETRELIAEIGAGNVGFVLDSWHWWNAEETAEDILTLKAEQIVAVDLNDAPAGIPREKQIDGQRELPMATGVIPVKEFLTALQKLGYDGPVRAEPFNKPLNDLDNDAACAKTAEAMKKAFATLG